MTSNRPTFYSVPLAAERLGVSRVSVWRWVRDGRLPAVRFGNRTTRIRRQDVERLLAQPPVAGPPLAATTTGRLMTHGESDSPESLPPISPAATAPEHAVQFYESDAFLEGVVAGYIGEGLRDGCPGIVLATTRHREGIEARLLDLGVDVAAAAAAGRYRPLDAVETLARLTHGGMPIEDRVSEVIAGVVSLAETTGRQARVFGEMVTLLAGAGHHAGALRMETIWGGLQTETHFSLLCAYPIGCFGADAGSDALEAVCAAHSEVIPAESYAALPAERERMHEVVALQEQAFRLRASVERQATPRPGSAPA